MIQKDLIYIHLKADTKEEIITRLADKLLEAGKVKDSFKTAVLKREVEYPTGLPLGKYNMAMPHTFAAHVIEPTIAVAKLDEPVLFTEMGTKDTELPVSLVMMMAISDPREQVGMLKKILRIFSEEAALEALMKSEDVDEMYKTLRYIDEK
ncbi:MULTISPECIES: PTS sugar transporter subunit IIA [Lachnospiraceae]|uniref:PTS sugar transporter subunit IIA n=1 Tax=Faecalicatena acetigenes TaxID=2981790 RepID=A0ABT2T7Y5_9FIRM|nr:MULTISPECIES: PTS sugar transporter subunit IIA [Lachnospiraceae]MCU6746106.1 PTS sugar transporter subunit IIA [Faecalicatena acetigenes]SCG95520.1 EIIBCA-Man [uncultured Clostridium sp.]